MQLELELTIYIPGIFLIDSFVHSMDTHQSMITTYKYILYIIFIILFICTRDYVYALTYDVGTGIES